MDAAHVIVHQRRYLVTLADHGEILPLLRSLRPTAANYVEEVFAPPSTSMSFSRSSDGHGFIRVSLPRGPDAMTVLVSSYAEDSMAILRNLCGADELPHGMRAAVAADATCRISLSCDVRLDSFNSADIWGPQVLAPHPSSLGSSCTSLIVTREDVPQIGQVEVEGPVEPTFGKFAMESFPLAMPRQVEGKPSPPTKVAEYKFDVTMSADIDGVPMSLPATFDVLLRRYRTAPGPGGLIPLILLTFRSGHRELSAMPVRANWIGRKITWMPGLSIPAIARAKGPESLRSLLLHLGQDSSPQNVVE